MTLIAGDKRIKTWYLIMVIASVVLIAATTSHLGISTRGDSTYYLRRHIMFLLMGFLIIYGISRAPLRNINTLFRGVDVIYILTLALVFMASFFGESKAEARRWISLGGFSFQPSELAKLTVILVTAKDLTLILKDKIDEMTGLKNLLMKIMFLTVPIALNNLSTAIIILASVTALIWVAEVSKNFKYMWTLIMAGLAVISLFVILFTDINVGRATTWRSRIFDAASTEKVINPWAQSIQAKVAIAKGGFISFKPGKSVQKNVIAQSYTDYIFSVIVEQFGFVGGVIVLLAYITLLMLIGKLISKLKRAFISYMIAGFGLIIGIQAFVHILVNVSLLPVTGQPLPFLSLGGSAILVNSMMIGLILYASRFSKVKSKSVTDNPVDYTFDKKMKIVTD